MDLKEYFDGFENEEVELLVRIFSSNNTLSSKGNGINLGNARFDKALLTNNTEFEDCKKYGYQWLEWIVKDDETNTNKNYKFNVGSIYHVKVKPSKVQDNAVSRTYYVLEANEYDAKDTLLDAKYVFERNYEDTEKELKVLIKQKLSAYSGGAGYRYPYVDFIGAIDINTDDLINNSGKLSWVEKETDTNHRFNLETLGIYRIKAKKSKNRDGDYLLTDVLGQDSDDRLIELKEKYLTPIKNNIANIDFILNKKNNFFEGEFKYLDSIIEINIYLSNENNEISNRQIKLVSDIISDIDKYNNIVKSYISNDLINLANDWSEDGEITKEEFYNILNKPYAINIYDNEVEFLFDDNDIFAGHIIKVDMDENGNCKNADIIG